MAPSTPVVPGSHSGPSTSYEMTNVASRPESRAETPPKSTRSRSTESGPPGRSSPQHRSASPAREGSTEARSSSASRRPIGSPPPALAAGVSATPQTAVADTGGTGGIEAETTEAAAAAGRSIDELVQASLPRESVGRQLHGIGSETVAKAIASFVHFGLARQFTEAGVLAAIPKSFVEQHPLASGIAQGAGAAGSLASAHYFGEVMLRPFATAVFGAKVVDTKFKDIESLTPEEAFPQDTEAQESMKALSAEMTKKLGAAQKNSKTSSAIGAMITLSSFSIVHGIRTMLGYNTPIAQSIASGIAGGLATAGQTTIALNSHVETEGGASAATGKVVKTQGAEDLLKFVKQSFESLSKKGDRSQLQNTMHEILVTRGLAALQGLLISESVKSLFARPASEPGPSRGEAYGEGMAGTLALLGLGFLALLTLSDRRTTTGFMPGMQTAKKNVENAIRGGGTNAMLPSTASRIVDTATAVTNEAIKAPANLALDALGVAANPVGAYQAAKRTLGGASPTPPQAPVATESAGSAPREPGDA